MNDHEGSVSTEDSDIDQAEETQGDSGESGSTTGGDTSETESKAQAESTDGTLTSQEQKDKADLTEKGTKLDTNPLSRVNQELANERAKIRQYEEVLQNPSLLKKYVAEFDKPGEQSQEKVTEIEIRYEDVQTTEDLQKFLRQQDSKVQSRLKELDSTISSVKSSQKDTIVANNI